MACAANNVRARGKAAAKSYLAVVLAAFLAMAFAPAPAARAVELVNVARPAALDQPQINVLLRTTPNGAPLVGATINPLTLEEEPTIRVQAYFDTGSSGILLSVPTGQAWGVSNATDSNGQPIVFEDVGVAGSDLFNVSQLLYVGLAPFNAVTDVENPAHYTQQIGPVRTQVGPVPKTINPLTDILQDLAFLDDLNIVGMPAMTGKVAVFDPRPTNQVASVMAAGGDLFDLLDNIDNLLMRSYVYNPGTPFQPASNTTDPGIPATSHHVKLSYGQFDRFTEITPSGATGPTLAHNPFIGPNPVLQLDPNPPADNTPTVQIGYDDRTAEGSFLLDTGAAASILSESVVGELGVRYKAGTKGTNAPILEYVRPDGSIDQSLAQFVLTIGGIGGTSTVAGFYLDSLLIRTMEGNPLVDSDPRHLHFVGAPVLVSDITLQDPATQQTLTLDGILGVNFLVGGLFVSGTDLLTLSFDDFAPGAFDWITFDEPNGVLGLALNPDFVEPLAGDFNQSGLLDPADIDLLYSHFGNTAYDLDGDGDADQADVDYFVSVLAHSSYGDADLTGGTPELTDYGRWRTGTGGWAGGDFDGSGGGPELNDYNLWRTGPTAIAGGGGGPPGLPTPEPATLVLGAVGAAMLLAGFARRQNAEFRTQTS